MSIPRHVPRSSLGQPVRVVRPGGRDLDDPSGSAYRLSVEYDDGEPRSWSSSPSSSKTPVPGEVRGLVIGTWQGDDSSLSSGPIVEALVAARESLPNLRALLLGDIISEENEISWIQQSDVTPLFDAFPELEHFQVRGGMGLGIGTLRHQNLRSLVVETGGLDREVVRGIGSSDLPRLEHLELWLGSEMVTVPMSRSTTCSRSSWRPISHADPARPPRLPRSADAGRQRRLPASHITTRLEVLDLSLGNTLRR